MNEIYMVEYSEDGSRAGYTDKRDAILNILSHYFMDEGFEEMTQKALDKAKNGDTKRIELLLTDIRDSVKTAIMDGYIEDYAYIDRFNVYTNVYSK
jgi:hypothetical protein